MGIPKSTEFAWNPNTYTRGSDDRVGQLRPRHHLVQPHRLGSPRIDEADGA